MRFFAVFSVTCFYIAVALYVIYTQDMQWGRVGITELGQTYNTYIPLSMLFIVRCLIAAFIWAIIFYIVLEPKGITITVEIQGVKQLMLLRYGERLTMFTVWAWVLQGLYFILAAVGSYGTKNINNLDLSETWVTKMPSIAWVLYEVSLLVSFIVSMVVTYVLLPAFKKAKTPTDVFFSTTGLILHNCNVLFMAWEFAVNGLPIMFWHFSFVVLLASAYYVFSWIWYKYKRIFYYFFTDYNRSDAVFWQIGLLVIFYGLHLLCMACSHARFHFNSSLPSLVIIGLALLSMKLRDK
jgi:hypothetical protein